MDENRMTMLRMRQEYLICRINGYSRRGVLTADEAVCKAMLQDWATEVSLEIQDLNEEMENYELDKELESEGF